MKHHFLFIVLLLFLNSCKYTSTYPIDEPKKEWADAGLKGKWKLVEDTNKNNFYEVYDGYDSKVPDYHTRFWNRGGTNPTYEANIYITEIKGVKFLNIPYWDGPLDLEKRRFGNQGYFFLRIMNINNDHTKIVAIMVADTTLRALTSSKKVRERINNNLNNAHYYYKDTFHFYKATGKEPILAPTK